MKLSIPHDGHVLICDGSKALLLRNEGDNVYPNLQTAWTTKIENPPTREQGSDQPTRVFESVGARRSGAEQTDYHDQTEEEFARDLGARLERLRAEGRIHSLIVLAPPRMLADLRRFLSPQVRDIVKAEIDKDLTNRPVYEIERYLTAD